MRRVIGPAQRGVGDLKLLSVADDRARRRRHVEVDPLTAEKCRSAQVRRDCELVARRYDVAGEPEVLLVGVQSHGHRRLVHVTWRPPSTDENAGLINRELRFTDYRRDSCRSLDRRALVWAAGMRSSADERSTSCASGMQSSTESPTRTHRRSKQLASSRAR